MIGVSDVTEAADSVDEDDGKIDNATNGALAHSIYRDNSGNSLTVSFDAAVLGRLPTHVGLVITDCSAWLNTMVEAFDASGRSLGTKKVYNCTFATDVHTSGPDQAARARFIGVVCPKGIKSVTFACVAPNGRTPEPSESPSFEVDHVQYGFTPSDTSAARHNGGNPSGNRKLDK